MTFRINDFSTKLIGGGARPTLFNVDLGTKFDPTLNLISAFMVQSTSLPASSIAPIELPYMGRKMRVAGDRTFDTWSVTVINDEDFRIRHAMESWMNRINSLEGNLMDTDGTVEKNGVCRFYQSDEKFIKQVRLLLSTLGIKSTM
jgi:hypothetical protein